MTLLQESTEMTFPLSRVRASFPALHVKDQGRPRVYLDNSAGTLIAGQAADAVAKTYREHNTYTGVFDSFSTDIDALVDHTYASMAAFLGSSDPGEIIIGANATTATFQLVNSMRHMFGPGDEIIVTHRDHEGNISPWLRLAEETGATIRWLGFNTDSWQNETDELRGLLNENTKLVALNYVSNLTGTIADVVGMTKMAKSAGALVFVDGVQYAPHFLVDAPAIGCDFFSCAPYKFFGPHLGVIWGRRAVLENCRPYKTRVAPEQLPDRFMVGCPPFELLAGLSGAIGYFETLGKWAGGTGSHRELLSSAFQSIETYEAALFARLLSKLQDSPQLKFLGPGVTPTKGARAPILSFYSKDGQLAQVSKALTARGIHFHWGKKFAFEASNYLGLGPDGLMRIGLSHYNSVEDVDAFADALTAAFSKA